MQLGRVAGTLVASRKEPLLSGMTFLVVRQLDVDGRESGSYVVAVDAVGAKPGDWVICVGSSAAREAAGSKGYPSDLTIVGIIDHWPPPDAAADDAGAEDADAAATDEAGDQSPGAG